MALEPQLADRFLLAAKRASQVIHPDVARVCSYGTTPDGSPFAAFERGLGTDLKVLALNHRLSTNCAVDIIARLLSAVQACHARGLLHRDIKPRNVIVHLEEATATVQSLKLTDVGLTEALCEDEA